MILLDTNVVSELLRSEPDPRVVGWADSLDPEDVGVAAISAAELHRGTNLLPPGRRRRRLEVAIDRVLDEVLGGRVLPFDAAAAKLLGERFGTATAAGRSPSMIDALIAATALAHGAALATRDVGPFEAMGVRVLDPWTA